MCGRQGRRRAGTEARRGSPASSPCPRSRSWRGGCASRDPRGGPNASEFNGPVVGWQERYRRGLAALGEDFADCPPDVQDRRLDDQQPFVELLYEHCCEGMYGAPEYGGNVDGVGWASIGFEGDVQPRGWSDSEVSAP